MEYYSLIKHIHLTAALLSFLGFLLRGYWMLVESHRLELKIVKILPHIIDTLLLGAAIYLVVILQVYPFVVGWVTAKLLLLIVYIVAGTIALKRGKTRRTRIVALVISVATIIAIFGLASVKPSIGL